MTTSFLGIPVEGTIQKSSRVPQRPLSDLKPLLQAVLDDDNVAKFGWMQYTPYFNDGDACIFGVRSLWAVPAVVPDSDDDYHDDVKYDERWGKRQRTFNRKTLGYDAGPYIGPYEATYDRLIALSDALSSEAFDQVLYDTFGDHAEITITRSEIKVDEYDHD